MPQQEQHRRVVVWSCGRVVVWNNLPVHVFAVSDT